MILEEHLLKKELAFIFVFLMLLPTYLSSIPHAHAGAREVELYYDDGGAELGFAASAGVIAAVRFSAHSLESVQVLKLRYYVWGEMKSIRVHVLDLNQRSIYSRVVTPTSGWYSVDISGDSVLVDGDFYVGWQWISESPNGPWLGFDKDPPYNKRSYLGSEGNLYFKGTGSPSEQTEDYMIRAVVQFPLQRFTFQAVDLGSDFPGNVLKVDATYYWLSQLPVTFAWDYGSQHSYEWLSPLSVSSGKRYTWSSTSGLFTARSNAINATSTGNVTGKYQTQYYLVVQSPQGSTSGSGWYDSGQDAQFGVSPSELPEGIGSRNAVSGFSGDANGSGSSGTTVMDRPRAVTFNWKKQYLLIATSDYGTVVGGGWYDAGSTANLSTTSPVDHGNGTRRVFVSWTGDSSTPNAVIGVLMDSPKKVTANWKTLYFLRVVSQFGEPRGEGWYDAGSTATFSVTSSSGLMVQQVISAWSGDSAATSASANVLMDGPKTVIANWRTDYTQLYLTVGVAFVVTIIFVSWNYRRRKARTPQETS